MSDKKDKKGKLDKVIMGAIIGGAIGSVLGASLAPKEGKETRKDIAETAKKVTEKSITIFQKVKNFVKRKKEIPHED